MLTEIEGPFYYQRRRRYSSSRAMCAMKWVSCAKLTWRQSGKKTSAKQVQTQAWLELARKLSGNSRIDRKHLLITLGTETGRVYEVEPAFIFLFIWNFNCPLVLTVFPHHSPLTSNLWKWLAFSHVLQRTNSYIHHTLFRITGSSSFRFNIPSLPFYLSRITGKCHDRFSIWN